MFHSNPFQWVDSLTTSTLQHASVYQWGENWLMSSLGAVLFKQKPAKSGLELLHLLLVSREWNLWVTMVGKLQDLQNELNQGYRITVSDGSFCDGKGTAPWIIEGKDNTHRLIGVWKTPGIPEDQSSYPSKLWGLYGILLTLLHIALNNGKPKLELACDGQASLQRAFSTYPINPTEAQADILLAIHKLRKTCQYTLSWSHIKGHQDQKEITMLHGRCG